MGFLTTILTDGRPGPRRIALWLKNVIVSLLRHPFKTVRVLQPLGWAREFVILLCMQALDGEIEMRWQRPWFWPFRKVSRQPRREGAHLHSEGQRVCAEIRASSPAVLR